MGKEDAMWGYCAPFALEKVYAFWGKRIPHLEIAQDLNLWSYTTFLAGWPLDLAIHARSRQMPTTTYLTFEYWRKIVQQHEDWPKINPGKDHCNYCRLLFFKKQGGTSVLCSGFTSKGISQLFDVYGRLLCVVDASRYTEHLGLTKLGNRYPIPHVTIVVACGDGEVSLEDPIWGNLTVPADIFITALSAHATKGMIIALKGEEGEN